MITISFQIDNKTPEGKAELERLLGAEQTRVVEVAGEVHGISISKTNGNMHLVTANGYQIGYFNKGVDAQWYMANFMNEKRETFATPEAASKWMEKQWKQFLDAILIKQ